jgi:hypothetical protein
MAFSPREFCEVYRNFGAVFMARKNSGRMGFEYSPRHLLAGVTSSQLLLVSKLEKYSGEKRFSGCRPF